VLSNLAAEIDPLVRDEIISVIRQLCLPDLARRGHPNGIGRPDQFSTRRYVTLFDVLGKKTDLRQRILDRSA